MFRLLLSLFAGSALFVGSRADDMPVDKSTLSISDIMVKAHLTPGNRSTRRNLDNKVIDGVATEMEKKELLALYTQLSRSEPPMGKLDDWKKRTGELVEALKAVYKGEEKAVDRFVKVRDCKACHTLHRKSS